MKAIVVLFAIAALLSALSFADEMKMVSKAVVDPASVKWGECPPNLPAGCKISGYARRSIKSW